MPNSTEQEQQEYSGDNFAFFALAFVTCVALPYTLALVRSQRRRAEAAARKAARGQFAVDAWAKERAEALAAANQWALGDAVKWGFAAALWLAWLVAFVAVLTSAPAGGLAASGGFDPFKVLEISPSASDAEIKSAYKLMSRKWHPDKNPDQKELAGEMFVSISRAYKTLTDEVARKNWVEYGNPDGPQGFSMGIALPAWLVERHNSYLVLVVYILLVLVVLPYGAVSMWNKWKDLAPNDVIFDTMRLFARKIKSGMSFAGMLELLAGAVEYSELPLRASDQDAMKVVIDRLQTVDKELRLTSQVVQDEELRKQGYVLKTTILLYAHLNRLHGSLSPQLRLDTAAVLAKAPLLASGLLSMLSQIGRGQVPVPLVESAMKVEQCLLQAVWPHQELQQLPHVHDNLIKELAKKRVKTVAQLAAVPADQRRRLLTGADAHNQAPGLYLTGAQVADVESVLARLPLHIAVEGQVKVDDEIAFISPNAQVTLTVTCQRTTAEDAKARTKITAADADNVAALIAAGVKLKGSAARAASAAFLKASNSKKDASASENSEVSSGAGKDDDDDDEEREADDWKAEKDEEQRVVDLGVIDAHAPYVPFDHPERHWLFVVDQRNFVLGMIKKTTINGVGRDSEKVKLHFQAPEKPGKYKYALFVVPDCYVGLEQKVEFQIDVHPAPELPPPVDEVFSDEEVSISDDEADDDDDDDVDDK